MVTVSTKGIYALAAMYVLSHSTGNKPMQLKSIAAMTSISQGYLEQILSGLRKADLVTSVRGAGGGYRLARKASEISVRDIVEALEGPLFQISGNVGSSAILEAFWQHLHDSIVEQFEVKLSEIDRFFQPHYYEI